MRLLAFDTSTTVLSIAVQHDDAVVHYHTQVPKQHTNLILPTIDRLLTESNLKLSELDAIAYSAGPGSYTGIRIANSVAQGLGFGANVPLIPLSSLAILAQTAWQATGIEAIAVVIDAHMQQIYAGFYRLENNIMTPVLADQLLDSQQLTNPADWPTDYLVAGDGWQKYPQLSISPNPVSIIYPDARAILPIAQSKFAQGHIHLPEAVNPHYLR